jgi:hypothetical protein
MDYHADDLLEQALAFPASQAAQTLALAALVVKLDELIATIYSK